MTNAVESTVEWPSALVKELADRRAILILGSGLSATAESESDPSVRPPTWADLISQLSTAAVPAAQRAQIDELIAEKKYVEAAEEVTSSADPQSLAHAFRTVLVEPHFKASQAHSDVMTIDQQIVVNLNYDRIYENWCIQLDGDSYVVTNFSSNDFVRNIRSPQRVVMKLHGSVEDPHQVIFSLSDYQRVRRDHPKVFNVLSALLLTRTVLFIGCGFGGDPDVEYVLTEGALTHEGAFPHYAFVSDRGDEKAFDKAKREGLNIKFIEFSVGTDPDGNLDYSQFSAGLADLKNQVLEARQASV